MTKSKKESIYRGKSGCLSAQFPKIDLFSKTCHDSPVRPTTKVDIDSNNEIIINEHYETMFSKISSFLKLMQKNVLIMEQM